MADALHIDFETRSTTDLRKSGVYRYFEDPNTGIWGASYYFGDDSRAPQDYPRSWWLNEGVGLPPAVEAHILAGGRVIAHNAPFERQCLKLLGAPVSVEQMDCTLSRGAALGLPLGLDHLAGALRLSYQKDAKGYAIMMRMARPRRIVEDGSPIWWDEPDKIATLAAYCCQDTVVEGAIDAKVLPLSERERAVWELDQRINDRGIMLDVPAIKRLLAVVEIAKKRLDRRMQEVTDGAVPACSNAKRLVEWINSLGVPCASIAKSKHEDILDAADDADALDLEAIGIEIDPAELQRRPKIAAALELRAQAAKASTAKLKRMLAVVCADGRARGLLQYHGSHVGRWAGRLTQPQNLPRVDPDRDGWMVESALWAAQAKTAQAAHDALDAITSPIAAVSKTLRALHIAAPGKRFVGGDLSNIEGCVNAWLSGEEWKVRAYLEYQAGLGPDLYTVAYARTFGGTPDGVSKPQRQVGKVEELALGYQGSVGAFISMAANYGVTPGAILPVVFAATPPEQWTATAAKYRRTRPKDRCGLGIEEWTALKVVVEGWRAAHPRIVQGWWDAQDAAIDAVANPGQVVHVYDGKVAYLCARGFLWCQLPSTRVLAYHNPRVRTVIEKTVIMRDTGEHLDAESFGAAELRALVNAGLAEVQEKQKRRVEYDGFDGVKKMWGTQILYGGRQCENICQGIARDVLVDGMFEAEARGYPIVLTVHDELLTEVPEDFGSPEELREIMIKPAPWRAGLPLDAKCWAGFRYEK
ncbi:MAG: hypothetical protein KGL35_09385 [Bradyrhizobium sp.]|nr:hypothetical protein [Bradyrhizobium sp.]